MAKPQSVIKILYMFTALTIITNFFFSSNYRTISSQTIRLILCIVERGANAATSISRIFYFFTQF